GRVFFSFIVEVGKARTAGYPCPSPAGRSNSQGVLDGRIFRGAVRRKFHICEMAHTASSANPQIAFLVFGESPYIIICQAVGFPKKCIGAIVIPGESFTARGNP